MARINTDIYKCDVCGEEALTDKMGLSGYSRVPAGWTEIMTSPSYIAGNQKLVCNRHLVQVVTQLTSLQEKKP